MLIKRCESCKTPLINLAGLHYIHNPNIQCSEKDGFKMYVVDKDLKEKFEAKYGKPEKRIGDEYALKVEQLNEQIKILEEKNRKLGEMDVKHILQLTNLQNKWWFKLFSRGKP